MNVARNAFLRTAAAIMAAVFIAFTAVAADYPAPKEGTWVARDFRFQHRRGDAGIAPALPHDRRADGRAGADPARHLRFGRQHADAAFAGELFGPGQPLDAAKYFIILPDAIGAGKSSKPSDGLRAKFPRYNYDDMVAAQYRLVTEGLGIRHLRLVLGNSMGGMHTWIWGVKYPDVMDALVPMASQPTEMSSRNWMMRRLIIDSIRNDPEWKNGDYTSSRAALQAANVFFGIATNGGTLAYQKLAPTREAADKLLDEPAGGAVHGRRQRLPLSVGIVARLQSRRRAWSASRPRCWRSIPPTTSAIRPRPASWSASSSA